MKYIKNIKEQNMILEKIKHLYRYNYIGLQNIQLYKKFKYGTFLDSSFTISYDLFFKALRELSLKDKELYIVPADEETITYFKNLHDFFPTVKKSINFKNGVKFLYTDIDNDASVYTYCENISIFSASFEWIVCINLSNELGCFSSNNKEIVIKFKNNMKKFAQKNIFLSKNILINRYNIAKNKEDFDSLPIGKLELI